MIRLALRCALATSVAAATLAWNGSFSVVSDSFLSRAEAVVGRPATPVSYAGVARRSPVGGVGGPASGVGVLPGAGAGQAGVGYSGGVGVNLGGPVNRVGVR